MTKRRAYSWSGTFADLPMDDQVTVAQLVSSGGAVVGGEAQIAARLKKAPMIVLLRMNDTDRIVGVAALKNPNPAYRLMKFADAGVPVGGFEDAYELGYVVVATDMRGKQLSGRLIGLIAKDLRKPTFATTDNDIIKNNLFRSGFRRAGREWQGKKGALSLWTLAPD